jgi:TonB-linked SusC/RagA family outer membrane protein
MDCKASNLRLSAICLILCLTLMGWASPMFAQQAKERNVTGTIIDENKIPMVGVTVMVLGTNTGTITDVDGKFNLKVPQGKNDLQISFIGYETATLPIPANNVVNTQMASLVNTLSDVVVIGYGTQKKGDLTGAVANVNSKDFNKGMIASPEQLINGKVSGVQITTNGGSPSAGSTIRIRGGASLNASNDPLIVLDGVPLESGGISGNDHNFLSLINPNDIESMTVLKDASSTAIYGSRASNGVIIITTKKGAKGDMKIGFTTTNSVQVKTRLADMLSTGEFRQVVESEGSAEQIALLGNTDTNWNDEIYQMAFGTDNNLSLSGQMKEMPYRVSIGYYNQDGILMTDNAQRMTGNFSLSPSFLNDDLKFNIGLKGSLSQNQFAQTDAIWGGATFNPTIPVMSGNDAYGGYTEALNNAGTHATSAVFNPVGLLKQYESTSDVNRFIGNFDVDYKIKYVPGLKFHATLGYDYAQGQGDIYVPETAMQYSPDGRDYSYGPQKKENKLLTTYFNYNKDLDKINSTIDVTAGYDYQYWKSTSAYYEETSISTGTDGKPTTLVSNAASDYRHVLLSYYGRLNYTLASRYMLTATVRKDGTSRFSENQRWGSFPSVALGWRLSEESFLSGIEALSNLKLRASYGITGQQEGIGNYNYIPVYTVSQTGAQYIFGNTVVNTFGPEAYISDLTWETTKAFNYGLDFGFFKNRLSGTVEYYTRKTEDLLATVPSPVGTNFATRITTNVGNVDSEGLEFAVNGTPIDNDDWKWDLSFNATWQKQTVNNISSIEGSAIENSPTGPTIDGKTVQVLTEGYSPNMFYVYHQLYDQSGKPIEGAYAQATTDVNGDGKIDDSDNFYRYHSPAPDYILGFSTSLSYKKWTMGTSLRAYIGNYVYNGMSMNTGAFGTMSYNPFQLNNLNRSYLETGFNSRQYYSDYYVENASFLKMDNLTLGYNFGKINDMFDLNATAMVQNVFTVTKYSGVDPEVQTGMDNSFYPRPRIFSLNLSFNF